VICGNSNSDGVEEELVRKFDPCKTGLGKIIFLNEVIVCGESNRVINNMGKWSRVVHNVWYLVQYTKYMR